MISKTLTVMFTDMKGFTSRTSRQSRDETLTLIKDIDDLLLPVIQLNGGNLVKKIGDALLVTFESATDAVIAGQKLQETLKARNDSVSPADRYEMRVGINTGEVTIADDGDVYGDVVNVASRVEHAAEPNEVYLTETTYLLMNRSEVPVTEVGQWTLKGLADRVKLYKVFRPLAEPDEFYDIDFDEDAELPAEKATDSFNVTVASLAPEALEVEEEPVISTPQVSPFPDTFIVRQFMTELAASPVSPVLRRLVALAVDILFVELAAVAYLNLSLTLRTGRADFFSMNLQSYVWANVVKGGFALLEWTSSRFPFAERMVHAVSDAWGIPEWAFFSFFGFCLIFSAYQFIMLACFRGTLGQKLLHVRLCTMKGKPPGVLRCLVRSVVWIPCTVLFGIGALWGFVDLHRRTLWDVASGTVVRRPLGVVRPNDESRNGH